MSMSTVVEGFIPPDKKFQEMLAVYRSCQAAGVAPPQQVISFFNGEEPDEAGVRINLSYDKRHKDAVREYSNADCSGYEIELAKLPKDIKLLRILNCW